QVQLRIRRDRRLALADAVPRGDQGRHLRRQPQRLAGRGVLGVVPRVRIVRRERRHAGAQDFHRRGLLRQRLQERHDARRQLAVRGGAERLGVRLQLLLARKPTVPQEEDDFLEGRVLGQIIDVVAAIDEAYYFD